MSKESIASSRFIYLLYPQPLKRFPGYYKAGRKKAGRMMLRVECDRSDNEPLCPLHPYPLSSFVSTQKARL